jgi:hypothetical protein
VCLIRHLQQCELATVTFNSTNTTATITAKGFELVEGTTANPLTIFVTSTCYDLLDLRSELADDLESHGHIVRLSDDWERFVVSAQTNSIDTCLQNLAYCDVAVCILDRRYGPPLPKDSTYPGISATHAELNYARKKQIPIFFYIRDRAEDEYKQLQSNSKYKLNWVQNKWKKEWSKLVDYAFKLPEGVDYSNWRERFSTVVDLKKIVAKQLDDYRKNQNRHG